MITKTLTIWCEWPECVNWTYVQAVTRQRARLEARQNGWSYRQATGDRCPQHDPYKVIAKASNALLASAAGPSAEASSPSEDDSGPSASSGCFS